MPLARRLASAATTCLLIPHGFLLLLFATAQSPAAAASGSCATSAEVSVLPSPVAPWTGAASNPPSLPMIVYGVAAVSSLIPLTPGGAGVQQALLVKVFAGSATGATVAAYSVGQQIAIAAFSAGLGFVALALVFRMRSFKEVIRRGREDRDSQQAAEAAT